MLPTVFGEMFLHLLCLCVFLKNYFRLILSLSKNLDLEKKSPNPADSVKDHRVAEVRSADQVQGR